MTVVTRYSRTLWLLTIAIVVLCCIAYTFRDMAFRSLIRPGNAWTQLDELSSGPSTVVGWARRPESPPPGAWETPWGVDVYFIHPTTAIWSNGAWNGDLAEGAILSKRTTRAMELYVGALSGAGEVYAPTYRQAVLNAMVEPSDDARAALGAAYAEILAAFDAYVAADNNRRAIIVVGVEQGGLHAARLLQDRFADGDLRERLGAAYLIDVAIAEEALPIPVCASSEQVGCVVAWRTSRLRARANGPFWPTVGIAGDYSSLSEEEAVCVNPLSWRRDENLAPRGDHVGGVARFNLEGEPIVEAGVVSAQCDGGILRLIAVRSSNLRPSDWWGWGKQIVPADFNLFYEDLAANVSERARLISVQLDATGRKPARPLPPVRELEDPPIHRPEAVQ